MDEKNGYKDYARKRLSRQWLITPVFLLILFGGWKYPLLGFFIPLCMLLGIGLFRGRRWCDWYCPRGSFYDTLGKAGSPGKEIPRFLKSMSFRIFVLAFLMAMMVIQLIRRWPNPYSIGMFFVVLLTMTTTLGIILALILHQRTWCSFCPIGTIANLMGRNRNSLKIDSELCTECKLCRKVCPVQVTPYDFKSEGQQTVKDGDCIRCGLCVSVCPRNALHIEGVRNNK